MTDTDIEEVVVGSILEVTEGVIAANYVTKEIASIYKKKELLRFKNKLLFDPIVRVAREPIRKLRKEDRIVLGLRLVLFNGMIPKNIAIGAKAALFYDNHNDKESIHLQNLILSIGIPGVLKEVSGIELFDPLSSFIIKQDLSKFLRKTLSVV